jgi:hypothetical protein
MADLAPRARDVLEILRWIMTRPASSLKPAAGESVNPRRGRAGQETAAG